MREEKKGLTQDSGGSPAAAAAAADDDRTANGERFSKSP
jgi:hypothetical protein